MARSLDGVTAFVLDSSRECSGIEPACEGVCHCQSFVHQTNTAPFAGQSDTCGAGRAQLNPSVMPGRATVFFSQSSIMIHVFYWNSTQQKCWSGDDSFRSRGRPKALYAVRLGVRGAKWCAGQLGGRARVQRGGDLSRHLPPRRRFHAAAAITKKVSVGVCTVGASRQQLEERCAGTSRSTIVRLYIVRYLENARVFCRPHMSS